MEVSCVIISDISGVFAGLGWDTLVWYSTGIGDRHVLGLRPAAEPVPISSRHCYIITLTQEWYSGLLI